jgi:hypothetical protein
MREFIWCRQEIAEYCLSDGVHIHVCVTTPGYRVIRPRCGRVTLNMLFHDLDPAAIRRTEAFAKDPKRGQELIDGCFTEAQAAEMAGFVAKADKDHMVIVNCEAGISRSPGIVLAFRRAYGGDTEAVFKKACPNIHVASVLGKELGVGPFQARKYKGIIDPFAEEKAEWQKDKDE